MEFANEEPDSYDWCQLISCTSHPNPQHAYAIAESDTLSLFDSGTKRNFNALRVIGGWVGTGVIPICQLGLEPECHVRESAYNAVSRLGPRL